MSPLALISVSDKTNIINFSKVLIEKFGYKILSSGGTAQHLIEAKVPVIKISEFTNSPEILEGRVKTLHPKIHGGILANRSNSSHLNDVKTNNIELIDLVVVNLYPFQKKVADNCSWEEAIENIDIGGPSMIRSAAKNHKDVSILVNHNQYEDFLNELSRGKIKSSYKTELALKAFEHTASYDSAIFNWMIREKGLKQNVHLQSFPLIKSLRYGENPHQKANWYGLNNIGWHGAKQLQGKELSYNNLLDLESALSTVLEFNCDNKNDISTRINAAVILKHNNPCGAALADSLSNAFKKALECDSTSAFGGIVAFNNKVDINTAKLLTNIFLECVVAPYFDKDALEILKDKKNLRLLEMKIDNTEKDNHSSVRSIFGGILVQDNDNEIEDQNTWKIVTNTNPTQEELDDIEFSWKICKHVKSNAIVIAKNGATIGIGAGQMNRVGAAKIALESAKYETKGAVLASDGFFPFSDSVELAHNYGIKAIIQPGGSVRDEDSIKKCNELGISMIFTHKRHFLH
tara:strand:+ start:1031 stop:2584 length:1554 start_codon:yes stop_codon:yes gene_type:complete